MSSFSVTAFSSSSSLAVISTAQIRTWIRHSDLENLEQCVLDGHGHALITENASDSKIRAFIKSVPSYMVSLAMEPELHNSVVLVLPTYTNTGGSINYQNQHTYMYNHRQEGEVYGDVKC